MIKPASLISFILAAILLAGITSCGDQSTLISNKNRLDDIQHMLNVQKELTKNSKIDIWGIFTDKLSKDETQAMEFLYAYMPLSDLADYSSSFFLENVKRSLEARQETSWGKTIPEDVFLHFVLPLRVNNENLDSFRIVLYSEIMERIKGMDMTQAALEINHWCHEKVNYRGTDGRTSAPLSTIKKSFGRCGEESTFTVSAMRAAGIPARQVYTPRWAHTDDNHAWVEVWIEGKWHYLGACEPEPELDMGWFSEPSRRTMLVHTRAYGRYFGTEDVVNANDRFSELNLTSNYSTVKDIYIKVNNPDGNPADSAKVEFKLYNYAEFYPIATSYTNQSGVARLKTGMGDLLIWVSKDGKYNYQKLSVPQTDTLTITLKSDIEMISETFDMVPPHAVKVSSTVSKEERAKNDKRLAQEDSIRNHFMSTFKDSVWAVALATKLGLSADTVRPFILKSYGNWQEVSAFLEKNSIPYRHYCLAFLSQISDKDFSDTHEATLTDQLVSAMQQPKLAGIPEDIYIKYVLSPRISIEFLSAWRSFLQQNVSTKWSGADKDISVLTNWIREHVQIDNNANLHSRAPLSSIGVYNLGVANAGSRDIFFVAACRSLGIPARLNPETQVPEYWKNGEWLLAGFDAAPPVQPAKGNLQLTQKNNPVEPQYYYHFTIAKIEDGISKTLEFEEGKKVSDFPKNITLDTGRYVLITGNRLEDGTVLSSMTSFKIDQGTATKMSVELRKLPGDLKASGKLDFLSLNLETQGKITTLATLANNKSLVVMLIDPDKEPSKHILNDLGPYVDHFDKWDGIFVVAMPQEKNQQAGVLKTYNLPKNLVSGVDKDDNLFNAVSKVYGVGKERLPLVMVCDSNGNVYLFSAGYKIGVGEQILKVTPALAKIQASCAKPK